MRAPDVSCCAYRSLKRLRRVTLRCGANQSVQHLTGTSAILRTLGRGPGFEALDMQYATFCMVSSDAATKDMAMWLYWPRLKGLSIIDANAAATPGYNAPVLKDLLRHRLPMLSGLTRLQLSVFEEGSGAAYGLQVCATLTELTRLQKLRLDVVGQGRVQNRDCVHLTVMQSLTSLTLGNMREAVGDMVAVALACSLPELRYLDLTKCSISTDTPMPVFARMRHLTKIVLTGNRGSSSNSVALLQAHRGAAGLPSVIVLK